MRNFFKIFIILVSLSGLSLAASENLKLFVDGVRVDARPVLKDGMPYFPVSSLSRATNVKVESIQAGSVKLEGCPVKFVAVMNEGRPYLPAEAFAMATGGRVERDEVRGLILYKSDDGGDPIHQEREQATPESPEVAPPANYARPVPSNVPAVGETSAELMKAAASATYAERLMRHKLYWANQLDPANSPYMQHSLPPVGPTYPYTNSVPGYLNR